MIWNFDQNRKKIVGAWPTGQIRMQITYVFFGFSINDLDLTTFERNKPLKLRFRGLFLSNVVKSR